MVACLPTTLSSLHTAGLSLIVARSVCAVVQRWLADHLQILTGEVDEELNVSRYTSCCAVQVLKQLSIPESYIPSQKNILILSLGCGEAKVDKERKEKEGSPEDWRLLQWAKKSTGLAMAGTGYSPDLAMFFPYLTCARMPCYLRLQPVIAAELEPMDRSVSCPLLVSCQGDTLEPCFIAARMTSLTSLRTVLRVGVIGIRVECLECHRAARY